MGIFKEISDWWNDLFKDDVTKEQEQKMITELAGMEAKERERLENIVKEYAASNRPQDLEFEYLEEYVPIDNETLMDKSEKQYSEIYNAEKDLANEKYQEKLNKVEETEKDTNIFIYPGYKFKCVDALITNFHLQESTLLMLVSALAGKDYIIKAYKEAVKEKYRFFSFGDAMFIK